MKNTFNKFCTGFFLMLALTFAGQNAWSQCGPAGFQFPGSAVTPGFTFSAVSSCSWAGDYFLMNVTLGENYTISTCAADGSDITYDSELTMWEEPSLAFIAYSDDDCGFSLQSSITFTATYTGQVRVNLNEVSCNTNTTCGMVMIRNNGTPPPPPANDDCSGAIPVALTNGVPHVFNGNTAGATPDVGTGYYEFYPTVWDAVTVTGVCNNLVVSYCGSLNGVQNVVWGIIDSQCPASPFASMIFSNSFSSCSDGNTIMTFNNLPAGTYYIPTIGDFFGINNPGPYVLTVTSNDCPPPPPNDDCSAVTPVVLSSGVPQVFTGTTVGATPDGGWYSLPTVWDAVTTTTCTNMEVSYCGTTPAHFNQWIIIDTQCQNAPFSSAIFANSFAQDCGGSDFNYTIHYNNLPAGTYYIATMGDDGSGQDGPYVLTVTATECPPPPPNDDCSSVTPVLLADGVPQVFTGTTAGATPDGPFFFPTVWHAVEITECASIKVSFCGTTPAHLDAWLNLAEGCNPVTGFPFASDFAQDCGPGDANYSIYFDHMPAGIYYIPVLGDDGGFNEVGPYILTVTATYCPGIPDNDDPCAAYNGDPRYNFGQITSTPATATFDNYDATAGAGEQGAPTGSMTYGNIPTFASCNAINGWCAGAEGVENSLWYYFVAPSSGRIQIDAGGGDTQIALWLITGNCDDYPDFQFAGYANDDESGFPYNSHLGNNCIGFSVQPDQGYFLQVDGYFGTQIARGTISIVEPPPPGPPSNDVCSGAISVSSGNTYEGSTDCANIDAVPTCGTFFNAMSNSVWYSLTGTGDRFTITTCGNGTDYDSQLHIFTGGCGNLNCVTGNDDACGLQSSVSFCTSPGVEYLILVDGYFTSFGDFQLNVSSAPAFEVTLNPSLYNCGYNISCNGANDGSISAEVTGGQSSYSYLWSPGNETTAEISGLGAGTYSVVITDAEGCSESASITLTEPDPLVASVCPNQNVALGYEPLQCANVTSSATGGCEPYSYSWNNADGSTTSSITVCPAATTTYTVTITDANGCTSTAAHTVTVVDLRCSSHNASGTHASHDCSHMGGSKATKVLMCKPSSHNPSHGGSNSHGSHASHGATQKCVKRSDVAGKLAQGWTLGSCNGENFGGGTCGEAPGPVTPTCTCKGKITSVTLTYVGAGPVSINVYKNSNHTNLIASYPVVLTGQEITFGAAAGLPSKVYISVSGQNCDTRLNTKCKDLVVGSRIRNFDVTAWSDNNGNVCNGSATPLKADQIAEGGLGDAVSLAAYPNPFNDATTIEFSVSETQDVKVEVFNMTGSSTEVLFDGVAEAGASYKIPFKPETAASGIYFTRMTTSTGVVKTEKLVLQK